MMTSIRDDFQPPTFSDKTPIALTVVFVLIGSTISAVLAFSSVSERVAVVNQATEEQERRLDRHEADEREHLSRIENKIDELLKHR